MILKEATATITAPTTLSVEDYIAMEEAELERRFEYIDGELYEMPGGTFTHDNISLNLIYALYPQLIDSDCALHTTGMRVRVGETRYVYPDLSVVCGEPVYGNNGTTLLNPVVAFEIISPSSIYRDRVDKRDFYTSVPTMQAYLIIDQAEVYVESYMRAGRRWQRDEFDSLDDIIEIEALGCRLPLSAIYRGVALD